MARNATLGFLYHTPLRQKHGRENTKPRFNSLRLPLSKNSSLLLLIIPPIPLRTLLATLFTIIIHRKLPTLGSIKSENVQILHRHAHNLQPRSPRPPAVRQQATPGQRALFRLGREPRPSARPPTRRQQEFLPRLPRRAREEAEPGAEGECCR